MSTSLPSSPRLRRRRRDLPARQRPARRGGRRAPRPPRRGVRRPGGAVRGQRLVPDLLSCVRQGRLQDAAAGRHPRRHRRRGRDRARGHLGARSEGCALAPSRSRCATRRTWPTTRRARPGRRPRATQLGDVTGLRRAAGARRAPAHGWLAALDELAAGRPPLKFRTGGLDADAFPAPPSSPPASTPRSTASCRSSAPPACTTPSGTPTRRPASSTTASSTSCWPRGRRSTAPV